MRWRLLAPVMLVLAALAPVPAAAVTATATVQGIVVAPDGSPVPYFRATIYARAASGQWSPVTATTWGGSWDVPDLPDGRFQFSLAPGTYRICAAPAGYEWASTLATGCWTGRSQAVNATDLVLAAGTTRNLTIRLPLEGSLSGRVLDTSGKPVANAYVPLWRDEGTWTQALDNEGYYLHATTDAAGAFTVGDLDPGRYRFCAEPASREYASGCWKTGSDVAMGTDITVQAGGARTGFAIRLAHRASVAGTITVPAGSDGSTYPTLYRQVGGAWEYAGGLVTRSGTGYRIGGLDTGTYRVCAGGDDLVTICSAAFVLAAGQTMTGVNLAPALGGVVQGTLPAVYLGAQGYPLVSFYRMVNGAPVLQSTTQAWPGDGSDWLYEDRTLPSGTYRVCVEHAEPEFVPGFAPECFGGSPTPASGDSVRVVQGSTTSGIDIATEAPSTLKGRVTGLTTAVTVQLFTAKHRLAASTKTVNGAYAFGSLPAGDYTVKFGASPARTPWAAEFYRNVTDGRGVGSATYVTLTGGTLITGISGALDTGGTASGTLVDHAGAPVPGCAVIASGPGLSTRTATTSASGAFAVTGLSTATYALTATCGNAAVGTVQARLGQGSVVGTVQLP